MSADAAGENAVSTLLIFDSLSNIRRPPTHRAPVCTQHMLGVVDTVDVMFEVTGTAFLEKTLFIFKGLVGYDFLMTG